MKLLRPVDMYQTQFCFITLTITDYDKEEKESKVYYVTSNKIYITEVVSN